MVVVDKNGNTSDIPLASWPMNGTVVTPGSKLVKQKEEHGEQQNNPNRLNGIYTPKQGLMMKAEL